MIELDGIAVINIVSNAEDAEEVANSDHASRWYVIFFKTFFPLVIESIYSRYHNDRPMQLFYTDGISKPISTRKGYGAGRRLLKH